MQYFWRYINSFYELWLNYNFYSYLHININLYKDEIFALFSSEKKVYI